MLELYEIIDALEKSRLRVKKTIADMLMKAFKSEEKGVMQDNWKD